MTKKVTNGTITMEELESIVDKLKTQKGDTYELLLIIGRSGELKYRDIVEEFLFRPDDPMLSRLSLQILCRYFHLSSQYRDDLLKFAIGVDWDEDEDVRLMAIDCIGSLLAESKDDELLDLIYTIFKNENERQIIREAAYCSLATWAGVAADHLPSAARHFDLKSAIDSNVIKSVENHLYSDLI